MEILSTIVERRRGRTVERERQRQTPASSFMDRQDLREDLCYYMWLAMRKMRTCRQLIAIRILFTRRRNHIVSKHLEVFRSEIDRKYPKVT